MEMEKATQEAARDYFSSKQGKLFMEYIRIRAPQIALFDDVSKKIDQSEVAMRAAFRSGYEQTLLEIALALQEDVKKPFTNKPDVL